MSDTQDVARMGVDQTREELEHIADELEASAYHWDHEHAKVIRRAIAILCTARWENADDAANWWGYDLGRNLHKAEREAFKAGFQWGTLTHSPAPGREAARPE